MAEMSTRQRVVVRDLVEEAKKRAVILAICVVGLSYLMSLTSSSVLVNLPAAASLIILLRYFSLDFEMRRKAAIYKSKPAIGSTPTSVKPLDSPKASKWPDWRRKVSSPVVEDAMDQFTKHLISEWVTDLWYSRLTPDKQGPEELVQIINGVLGEISQRMRKINLIDLLTRDLIDLITSHLEHFRANQAKIEKQQSGPLNMEKRDMELKRVLSVENKLHPALFSSEAEHKVLQHLMDGLISLTFRPEDLQCLFFRYIVRELLACAVMRPVLNLASPRFINERIESAVISVRKAKGGASISEDASQGKANGSSRISSDHFSKFLDPSITGVELVQLKSDKSKAAASTAGTNNADAKALSKDPLLSMDTRTSRSWSSLPSDPLNGTASVMQRHQSGGEWGNMLDVFSRRKTEALAPENFENMWAKGRNYIKKEDEKRTLPNSPRNSSLLKPVTADQSNMNLKPKENFPDKLNSAQLDDQRIRTTSRRNPSTRSSVSSYQENDENTLTDGEDDFVSSSSCTSQDEETDDITGLDAPGTKVWDARSNRNSAGSHIHHPLENSKGHKRSGRRHMHYQRISRIQSSRNRSRVTNKHLPLWKEGGRTSFHSGDGQDILMALKEHVKDDDSSDDSEVDFTDRIHGLSAASSATYSNSQNCTPSGSLHSSFMVDSFFKLRCEVLGANVVKSDSKTFAVYSISVTDVNSNNSWSIKRRFRHFEELHRRLKEFPEYNLHLPPKHFLSTGLDVSVIQERCKLLDRYLKELLQLPRVSGSIEVWDFLSVDSQTYLFSNSFSILETLSVDLDNKPSEKGRRVSNISEHVGSPSPSHKEQSGDVRKESAAQVKDSHVVDGLRNAKDMSYSSTRNPSKELGKSMENGFPTESILKYGSHTENIGKKVRAKECDGLEGTSGLTDAAAAAADPTLPVEWVPPNLSVPILDLVDVVFQLQEGGWIRRKAFWVAKQVLQLGMGDALDDWLIEKIQLLRMGSVVASGIKRIEQILWPDGIFLTKHPRRQQAPSSSSPPQSSPRKQTAGMSSSRPSDEQQQEAERRANFVYELMIENAPAPVVSLVGRKEYEQCAKDLYFFLQSAVCMKQLAFELLELLLLSAFPEMDYVFKQLHEEKHKFGEFKTN